MSGPEALRDPRAFEVHRPFLLLTDDAQLGRLLRGDKISKRERKTKWVQPGKTVEGIPSVSVKWMLREGWISEVKTKATKPGKPAEQDTPVSVVAEATDGISLGLDGDGGADGPTRAMAATDSGKGSADDLSESKPGDIR